MSACNSMFKLSVGYFKEASWSSPTYPMGSLSACASSWSRVREVAQVYFHLEIKTCYTFHHSANLNWYDVRDKIKNNTGVCWSTIERCSGMGRALQTNAENCTKLFDRIFELKEKDKYLFDVDQESLESAVTYLTKKRLMTSDTGSQYRKKIEIIRQNAPSTAPDKHSHLSEIDDLVKKIRFCPKDDPSILSSIPENDPILNQLDFFEGFGALHFAVENGFIEIAEGLIKLGANVNLYNYSRQTPLFRAAHKGNTAMGQMLVKKGADVNAGDSSILASNASKIDFKFATLLLDNGADLEAKSHGHLPLETAASFGHIDVVRLFLERGAKVNATSDSPNFHRVDQITAVEGAVCRNRTAVVELLLDYGADIHTKAEAIGGGSLLFRSISNHDPFTAKLLISRGVYIEATDDNGNTALHKAALYNDISTLSELLSRKADVYAVNNDKKTPLDTALLMHNHSCAEILKNACTKE